MLLNGEVIWQASDSSLSQEVHASILLTKCSLQIVEFYAQQSAESSQTECFKMTVCVNKRLFHAWVISCVKCSKIDNSLTGCILQVHKIQPSLMRFTIPVWTWIKTEILFTGSGPLNWVRTIIKKTRLLGEHQYFQSGWWGLNPLTVSEYLTKSCHNTSKFKLCYLLCSTYFTIIKMLGQIFLNKDYLS